jgi:hypothetical protein
MELSATTARERFPAERLKEHRGRWVAFNNDFSEVLAASTTLDHLESVLAERRIDPQSVYFEFIPGPESEVFLSPETPHEVCLPE